MSAGEALGSIQLTDSWQLALSVAGECENASGVNQLNGWIGAQVPGTAAGALAAEGLYDPAHPRPLHDQDIWYKRQLETQPGRYRLIFHGLATVGEVYVNGTLLLATDNMFRSYDIAVDLVAQNEVVICFRALEPLFGQKGPRARWKPQLANSQGLRLVRTTLLGRMPGWCPEYHAVGPYRPIELIPEDLPSVEGDRISADLNDDGSGALSVSVRLKNIPEEAVLVCGNERAKLIQDADTDLYKARITVPDMTPWMPHTHGEPKLYKVDVEAGGQEYSLGKVGFRQINVDRGADDKGFGLKVNGVPVFCRGAVWTNADLLNLKSDRETYRPLLEAARDAGMNMLRIGGTMVYESRAFFELCDELGILVWQDFQFANYDYPIKDEAFVENVQAEVRDQLRTLQGCPSLAVLCGGSEIYQQGAMMGLPESRWKGALCETILPEAAETFRPDVPYVANSPCEGVLPFSPNEGVAHYYGVGAYLRPLDDARRAKVRFAGECLAFSNIPDQKTLDEHMPAAPGHDPDWKAGIPRDRGAGWDFEDVRDHYLKTLYGIESASLRYGDPQRYLDLGRLVTGDVMEQTFAEWRRDASECLGALVWTYQDLAAGAGWGVVDCFGRPKPAYYALIRAFRPLQVSVTDEGTNGLDIHVINDRPEIRPVTVTLDCLRDGKTKVAGGQLDLDLNGHSATKLNAVELIGAFFDVTYAYRFGPPSHDATVVRLLDRETGKLLADAVHFPLGFDPGRHEFDIATDMEEQLDGSYLVSLTSSRLARGVQLEVDGYQPSDNWFSLAPGAAKIIELKPLTEDVAPPAGLVRAINLAGTSRIAL